MVFDDWEHPKQCQNTEFSIVTSIWHLILSKLDYMERFLERGGPQELLILLKMMHFDLQISKRQCGNENIVWKNQITE